MVCQMHALCIRSLKCKTRRLVNLILKNVCGGENSLLKYMGVALCVHGDKTVFANMINESE